MSSKWINEKGKRTRVKLLRFLNALGFREEMLLILIAILVGVAAGLSAIAFGWMVRHADDFFFVQMASSFHILDQKIYLVPFIPAIGAFLVSVLITYVIPQAKGPGVPSVVHSLTKQGGIIPFRVAVGKAVGSAVTIGSGGSAGTEAPIIHIGSTMGSVVGQWLKLSPQYMPVIVASGAAAGFGAIFNAPIAGVLFALEIFLQDINYKTFTPVVVASVTASTLSRAVTHNSIAIFALPSELNSYNYQWYELGCFVALGLLCALVSVGFIRTFSFIENVFQKLKVPSVFKPAIGAFLVGIIGLLMLKLVQSPGYKPAVFGNGYDWIQYMLNPAVYGFSVEGYSMAGKMIFLLLVLKLLATCLTLGSGGVGGEFGPALFFGSSLGASFMLLLQTIGISFISTPTNYAIVGMAGLIAGTTHAPLTAILLLFELTGNYSIILPIMIASVLSTTCAQLLESNSIYTLHLKKLGIQMGGLADITIMRKIPIHQVPITTCPVIHPESPVQVLVEEAKRYTHSDFIVTDSDGKYIGMISRKDFRAALLYHDAIPLLIAEELMKHYPPLYPTDTLETALNRLTHYEVESLPVIETSNSKQFPLGVVTHTDMMKTYQRMMQKMKR
jgi:CIC family chloride channel protein